MLHVQYVDYQVFRADRAKRQRKQRRESTSRAATTPAGELAGHDSFPLLPTPSGSAQTDHDQSRPALLASTHDIVSPLSSSNAVQCDETQDDGLQSSEVDEGENPTAFTAAMNNKQTEDPSAPFYAGTS